MNTASLDQLTTDALLTLIISAVALIISAVGVFVNLLYTGITLLLWRSTKKTVELNSSMLTNLINQTQHQIALSYTSSEHKIIDSHRELFLSLIEHPQLLKVFADNVGKNPDVVQGNILGTLLINHASSMYFYHQSNVLNTSHLESFIKDARDLFSMPFLRRRWAEVKDFHTKGFQQFVDGILLSDVEIDYGKLKELTLTGKENLSELIGTMASSPDDPPPAN